ncbi:cobalamin biosynthesis protein CobG [Sphingobium sp. H39-3-25]|uniref:cobalamin biosynthesis protein CobG n=1 Tax=Sphingobium arseniciresistens TaxID=3030834 RepID=UPI0023B8BC91|nr:cobalamin biosynthesis protein CobG [Sphingobium arseniciresistens]
MSGFAIKGWCPDAWHPMAAGDGLLVRVRPRLGQLTRAQVLGLCEAAIAHGNGLIDMTSRANLQIRGVKDNGWPVLLERLIALGLVAPDPVAEARHNILVAPEWQAGDDTARIATGLAARLDELPDLPPKVGFAIDAGSAPVLTGDPGDFRIERGDQGGLILRADGRPTGRAIQQGAEVDALIALAHWFADTGGSDAGRMARHMAVLPAWAKGDWRPAPPAPALLPGQRPNAVAYRLPFGQVEGHKLSALMGSDHLQMLRITPWRMLLVEGAPIREADGFLLAPGDPLARVDACPGAPLCPQATVETRDLARRLAPHVDGRLHVSGCAKGCARVLPAPVTLTGRDGLFDLALDARAGGPAIRAGLSSAEVLDHFGAV